ncbi:MAG: aminotransferase class IV [Chloroflexota bacterium]|nr:aminotransferase class IV [Chloroflexota bacterium]
MIYLNGQLLPDDQARINPADRGFLLGDGVFETMRAYRGHIFQLDAHLDRLVAGANFLGIPLPLSRDALTRGLYATLRANQLSQQGASLRLTLTQGPGPRGLIPPPHPQPTLLITAAPLSRTSFPPAKAIIASTRRNEHSPLAKIKSLNFLDNVLARREAAAQNVDEALLLNTAGNLAEASASNLFIVRDGILQTPPISDGALPGITRTVVLKLAAKLGIPAVETSLAPETLLRAEEAFLTNSIIEIRALVRVEGQLLGNGDVGEITRGLQRAYREAVGSGEL